jgi:hypothetical protein
MSDAQTLFEELRFQDPALTSGVVTSLESDLTEEISGRSLVDSGFTLIARLVSMGIVPSPRFSGMRSFTRRLAKTPYKGLSPPLVVEKLVIQLDGFIPGSRFIDFAYFKGGSMIQLLKLLWRCIYYILGAKLPWFHYRPPRVDVPLSIEDRGEIANLRLNHALSREPDVQGPLLVDVEDSEILEIHQVIKPSVDLLRFQSQAIANEYRSKNRLTLKIGPGCRMDSQEYLKNEVLVDSYYEFCAGPLRHLHRLLLMRRYASAFRNTSEGTRHYAREFIAAEVNYTDSLIKLKTAHNSISYYLGLDRPVGKPTFSPTSWVDPERKLSGREGYKRLFGPVRTSQRLERISEITRTNTGTSFQQASWKYVEEKILSLHAKHPDVPIEKIGTYVALENATALRNRNLPARIPLDVLRKMEAPPPDLGETTPNIPDNQAGPSDSADGESVIPQNSRDTVPGSSEQVQEFVTSYDVRQALLMLARATPIVRSRSLLLEGLNGENASFSTVPPSWWNQGHISGANMMNMVVISSIVEASGIMSKNPGLDRPSAEWLIFTRNIVPGVFQRTLPGTRVEGADDMYLTKMLKYHYISVVQRLKDMNFLDPNPPMDLITGMIPPHLRGEFLLMENPWSFRPL